MNAIDKEIRDLILADHPEVDLSTTIYVPYEVETNEEETIMEQITKPVSAVVIQHPAKQHIHVTRDGISTNDVVDQLFSERGKASVFQGLIFGATQSLISRAIAYSKFSKVLNQMKEEGRVHEATSLEASNRFLSAKEAAENAARRLVNLSTYAPEIEISFEATLQRGSSQEQLQQKAQFAGVEEDYVRTIEIKNALKKFQQANEATAFAESLFYSVDIVEVQTEHDADGYEYETTATHPVIIRPDHILKGLQRARDFILSWNNPDYAELGLIKADIETMEVAANKFEQLQENSTDGQFDKGGASSADLQAGNAA